MEKIIKLPTLGFVEAVKSVTGKLTDFNGRARRSELWWFYLLYLIVCIIVSSFVLNSIFGIVVQTILLLLISAVTVRRLHDRGHSGWWVAASILLNVFGSCYMTAKGYFEAMATVNPDPKIITEISSDPLVIVPSVVSVVVNITILVFSLLDSDKEANKYGESPKYVIEKE